MGSGIAQVMAMAGYSVILYEKYDDILSGGKESIKNSVGRISPLLTKQI